MKKYILIGLVFIGTLAYAQNTNQPKLEAKGDVTLATYFYENGAIQQEGTFDKKGKLEGLWTGGIKILKSLPKISKRSSCTPL